MKKILSCLLVIAAFCLLSCEKDGSGVSYLEGRYVLQSAEYSLTVNSTQGVYDKDLLHEDYLLDVPNKVIKTKRDGSYRTYSDKEWKQLMISFAENYAPVGLEFGKNGKVYIVMPEEWYADVEYWDWWFEASDLDDIAIPIGYSVKNNIITFSALGEKSPYFKILANTGNTLKVELTKQELEESGELLSEVMGTGFKVVLESCIIVYKKQ